MTKLACLVLAAGKASRFGSAKQLAPIHHKPMICHTLDQLSPLFPNDLYVVLGAYRDAIIPLIKNMAQTVVHEDWQQGMGSSLAKGMKFLCTKDTYDGVLIALADQIAIETADYQNLISLFDTQAIVAATYEGRHGVPAIFPADLFDQLQALHEDFGARKILNETDKIIRTQPMTNAAFDIDRPENLTAYLNRR